MPKHRVVPGAGAAADNSPTAGFGSGLNLEKAMVIEAKGLALTGEKDKL